MHNIFVWNILTWNGRYFKELSWKEFFWLSQVDMAGIYTLLMVELLQKGIFNLLLLFNGLIIPLGTGVDSIPQLWPGYYMGFDKFETASMEYSSTKYQEEKNAIQ